MLGPLIACLSPCAYVFKIILLYLGFLYLIGKEKKLPNLILEAYTYEYLKYTTDALSDFFTEQVEPINNEIEKENIK